MRLPSHLQKYLNIFIAMEALGAAASGVQILAYACNIVSTILDIRAAVRNGPSLLRDRSQQLEILSLTVRKIGVSEHLHSSDLARYLSAVQDRIQALHDIIRTRSQKPTDSATRRLRAALGFVVREKEVESSFASLQLDCQTLNLYMSAEGPDREAGFPVRTQVPIIRERYLFGIERTSTDDTGKEVALRNPSSAVALPETVHPITPPQAPQGRQPTMPKQTFSNNEVTGESSSQSFGNFRGAGPEANQDFTGNKATGPRTLQSFGNSTPDQQDTRTPRSSNPQ